MLISVSHLYIKNFVRLSFGALIYWFLSISADSSEAYTFENDKLMQQRMIQIDNGIFIAPNFFLLILTYLFEI